MPDVQISRWLGTRDDADPKRRLLVLPGMNFPISMPLLFTPSIALAEAGWSVWHASWDLSDIGHDDDALWNAVNTAASDLADAAGATNGGTTVVLGKSIGTLACGWAGQTGLAAVWLTPLLHKKKVAEYLTAGVAPALLIGGSADHTWDRHAADATGQRVLEVPDADHAIYCDDWRGYLRTVEYVTDAVLDFVCDIVGAPNRASQPFSRPSRTPILGWDAQQGGGRLLLRVVRRADHARSAALRVQVACRSSG